MCEIYAGQNPASYESVRRSLRLNGQSTSIRLEAAFWEILEQVAAEQGYSTNQFISELHNEVQAQRGEAPNFTSLLRCACLIHLSGKADRSEIAHAAE